MAEPIRIANCSGFFGDRLSAAREMVEGGPIDVLTGDWLAELTMLILARTRLKRPGGGYAGSFVRQMEQRATALVDTGSSEPEFISLPADFQSMRRVRLSSVAGKPCLSFKSGTQLDEYRFGISNIAGQPRYFTVFADEIELAPTPDAACTVEMVYRRSIPPLSANDPNWLLTLAPDLYLYGALLESAPYIKEDGRLQIRTLVDPTV